MALLCAEGAFSQRFWHLFDPPRGSRYRCDGPLSNPLRSTPEAGCRRPELWKCCKSLRRNDLRAIGAQKTGRSWSGLEYLVYADIFGDRSKLSDLRELLQKAARIVADSPMHEHGPNDTVGVIIAGVARTRSV